MKFKVGDKVRATLNCSGARAGEVYEVEVDGIGFQLKGTECCCEQGWELVGEEELEGSNSKKTLMKTINVMMKKLLDADTQKLVKAGLINGDLELTSEGQKVLMSLVFDTHKAALVKEAEEIIKEEETKKN